MRILNQPMISQDNVINKLRNAIMHRGLWMGLILKEVKEFANTFFTEDIKKVFEIEVIKIDENEFKVAYGYCPLVTAWQQIGIDGEMLATLCDIAMSGDRAICSRFVSSSSILVKPSPKAIGFARFASLEKDSSTVNKSQTAPISYL